MNCIQILREYLKDNEFDGIWNEEVSCACVLDDLRPCGEDFGDCVPGYIIECGCGEGCDFHIGPKQEEKDD